MEQRQDKIIQLIPAPEALRARTYDDNGNQMAAPVIALGLTAKGNVYYLIVGDNGQVERIREAYRY
jgi:hypothetical protein